MPAAWSVSTSGSWPVEAASFPIDLMLIAFRRIDDLTSLPDPWRLLEAVDQNGDEVIDLVVIEVAGEGIVVVRQLRDRI
jgi:hypothetical protein